MDSTTIPHSSVKISSVSPSTAWGIAAKNANQPTKRCVNGDLIDWITLRVPDFGYCTHQSIQIIKNGLIMDEEMTPAQSSSVPDDQQPSCSDSKPPQKETGTSPKYVGQSSPRGSQGSPQASVDETSLQKQRDKNKMCTYFLLFTIVFALTHIQVVVFFLLCYAALKVKLMLRRPVNQLVDQGIMPRKCICFYTWPGQLFSIFSISN